MGHLCICITQSYTRDNNKHNNTSINRKHILTVKSALLNKSNKLNR